VRVKYFRYSEAGSSRKLKTKTFVVLSIIGLIIGNGAGLGLAQLASVSALSSNVIYDNVPSPLPGNVVSEAFQATGTSEYGGQVSFAGTRRYDPKVTVVMSSWGCESGSWTSDNCVTVPGSTFSEPITLNVYNVGTANSVGALVATQTETFNIPYRPSANNTRCTGPDGAYGYSGTGPNGEWYDASQHTCYNGLATPISFDLSGVTLPDTAIVTVAYNTSTYGAQPYGYATSCYATSAGCGYDSLNVGLVDSTPMVGSNPAPNSDYLNSTQTWAYCDNGDSGVGQLRFDPVGSTQGWDDTCPYSPAIKVTASKPKLVGSVTGNLTLGDPDQQIVFDAYDYGSDTAADHGLVDYQNYSYPGGLHYTANVECANVSGDNATFMFQIPTGYPGLSGLYVVAAVHDGGSPAKKYDTYGHTATSDLATAMGWCENGNAPVTQYPITAGTLEVHDN